MAIAALTLVVASHTAAAVPLSSAVPLTSNTDTTAKQAEALQNIQAQVDRGEYLAAEARIRALLGNKKVSNREPVPMQDTPEQQSLASALAFEVERMRRIEMEFNLKPQDLLASVQRYIPDATESDIAQWDNAGLLEYKIINDERRYFRKAAYNLVHISEAAAARSNDYRRFTDKAPLYQLHPHHQAVIASASPLRQAIAIDYTLTVDADAVPAGETIRAWLPFPKEVPARQENILLTYSEPHRYELAPATHPQRTIYLEKTAEKGKATEFSVRYRFDSLSSYTAIDANKVSTLNTSAVEPYLAERPPHIQFTHQMRKLSERIVGDETNPYRIAQKLFAYVDEIPWAGAREYSTIRNISQYAAEAGHADCGQQTLLLMTLMRMNDIPARWQSGWEFSAGDFDTMHDWGEFYLAPYGWMPMDVTHGLLDGKTEQERWFYLGGIDSYRLIFNSDYSREFSPGKQHFRSETVDSQRGEVEWRGGNLYFDQWDYKMRWKLVESNDTPQSPRS
ncbi:transglutaminase domain-containing protein [Microbulbifer sp. CAU 1566]|uniref:transglutaminase-like domain-containing protein n=1 Tax=Microbulbifer sp. CAU 1566 TaxID=2933269 RepID=UPI002003C043|nr:transglutaminase domain-containing protein [Microbulbifer sp. CAU 1566]MCK7597201.1 transglutaminase domain-containing protein [Microbulbifer sp. CAU 1566]